MKTLIAYYDKDVLKNIMGVLTLRPDKAIFLYDSSMEDLTVFRALHTCFKRHIPHIQIEHYPVDILSMDKIYQRTCQIIKHNGNCDLELTGGSELMVIAGFRAGMEMGARVLHTDLVHSQITNLLTDEVVATTTTLSLEDFVDARGACFIGESHRPPEPSRYQAIWDMARYLFTHLEDWKHTCSFLQTVAARYLPHELYMESKATIYMKNGKKTSADKSILQEFQRLGFIKHLVMDGERVKFSYCSVQDRQYCIGYGVWLELYVYIAAQRSGRFDDVKLGTMIDWNAYDGVTIAGNEIDVILMEQSLPVFISCKLRSADTAALNELLIAKKRLGGWFSKGVIVTFGREKSDKTGTYQRAKELGITLLDATDILSNDFEKRLVRAIREHDLVSLKWKKI